ncbi:VWA domain-containing protein [Actinosynnema sp. NPDC020468]|uniref:VWA domain-containing protein n=1 Tax=Actinosynnema sp. NPDC020468 TaxID=3154488 RepID=UPI0034024D83
MTRSALLLVVLLVGAACTATPAPRESLTVLADEELRVLEPLWADLTRDTGVELRFDYRGTVAASADASDGHDLVWPSTDRFLALRRAQPPLSTSIMLSPLVLGVRPGVAARFGAQPSWAELASAAGRGELRYGMTDPRRSGSGLIALVGVATAAAGTGAALTPADVRCDKLQSFLAGRAFTAPDLDALRGRLSEVDGVAVSEAVAAQAGLDVVYPRDGIVLADFPLMLRKAERRSGYDRVVAWLRGPGPQRRIMETGHYRPVNPDVPRTGALAGGVGTALYFPGAQEVLDALLAAYDRAGTPSRVVFVLDHSRSMAGERLDALHRAFDVLAHSGGFDQFHLGETITVVRFAGQVLDERSTTITSRADLDAVTSGSADLADHTAVYSALDHAYRTYPGATVVLLTDGENNAGLDREAFRAAWPIPPRTYAIRLGDADPAELAELTRASGGRVVDATPGSLGEAVEEIRGCR